MVTVAVVVTSAEVTKVVVVAEIRNAAEVVVARGSRRHSSRRWSRSIPIDCRKAGGTAPAEVLAAIF